MVDLASQKEKVPIRRGCFATCEVLALKLLARPKRARLVSSHLANNAQLFQLLKRIRHLEVRLFLEFFLQQLLTLLIQLLQSKQQFHGHCLSIHLKALNGLRKETFQKTAEEEEKKRRRKKQCFRLGCMQIKEESLFQS